MADPRYNNAIAGAAYLIGLTPAELIECLWLASEKKEIRTVSGLPFVLPDRTSQKVEVLKVHNPHASRSRGHTGLPKEGTA